MDFASWYHEIPGRQHHITSLNIPFVLPYCWVASRSALKGSLGPLCYVSLVLSASFLLVYTLTALLSAGEGNPVLMVALLVLSNFALVIFDLFLSG